MTTTSTETTSADVLVIFGITGDLAGVMTFRSLYRLEARGQAGLPDRRRRLGRLDRGRPRRARARRSKGRANTSMGNIFDRFAARLSYVSGDHGRRDLCPRRRGHQRDPVARLLPRDPPVPVRCGRKTLVRGGPDGARACRHREAVRTRPGLGACAGEGAARLRRRVAAVPDRPLPGKMGMEEILSLRFANAVLEPLWSCSLHRLRTDHHGRELRRRGSRPLLRPRGCHPDVVVNHLMQVVAAAAMEPPSRGDPTTLKESQVALFRAVVSKRTRRTTSGASTTATSASRWPRLDHRDLCGAAPGHRELALGRGAFFIRTGEATPGDPDRAPADLQTPTSARIQARFRAAGARTSSSSSSTRRPESGSRSTRVVPTSGASLPSSSTWSSRPRAVRGAPPTRSCSMPP